MNACGVTTWEPGNPFYGFGYVATGLWYAGTDSCITVQLDHHCPAGSKPGVFAESKPSIDGTDGTAATIHAVGNFSNGHIRGGKQIDNALNFSICERFSLPCHFLVSRLIFTSIFDLLLVFLVVKQPAGIEPNAVLNGDP
jgi:hypothetical protein